MFQHMHPFYLKQHPNFTHLHSTRSTTVKACPKQMMWDLKLLILNFIQLWRYGATYVWILKLNYFIGLNKTFCNEKKSFCFNCFLVRQLLIFVLNFKTCWELSGIRQSMSYNYFSSYDVMWSYQCIKLLTVFSLVNSFYASGKN